MFHLNLKKIRTSKNPKVTQSQIAQAMGVTQQTVVRWENGSGSPDPNTLVPLAEFLGVSLDELCGNNYEDRFVQVQDKPDLDYFTSAQEAMKFILEQKQVEAFGGYDLDLMSEEEVIRFANDILIAIQVIGQNYKK